jgi:hypothetical protein
MHGAMAKAAMEGRIVDRASIDATETEARERAERKPPNPKRRVRLPGEEKLRPGPKKDQKRGERRPKRLGPQVRRPLDENLRELPRRCDLGAKCNGRGLPRAWKGYKLHSRWRTAGCPSPPS